VKFPPGARAVYTPTTGQLTVVNTADQMELLEELVNAGQAPTLMVRIATKFVEINQKDLNDFTVNSAFNFLALSRLFPHRGNHHQQCFKGISAKFFLYHSAARSLRSHGG